MRPRSGRAERNGRSARPAPAGSATAGGYGRAAGGRGHAYRRPPARRPSRVSRFVEAYGWRAYAIPVLIVATFLCGMDLIGPSRTGPSGGTPVPEVAAPQDSQVYIGLPGDDPGGDSGDATGGASALALPSGTATYTTRGRGSFHVVGGTSKVYGQGTLTRYTVEVEDGITTNERAFAAEVEQIIGDPRGWGAGSRMSFQRVSRPDQAAFRVSLTTPMTVREMCGYTVRTETSCYNGGLTRAVINQARWVRGALSFAGDLPLYHQYVVTHEVGHAFGRHHELCSLRGGPAPVMMQQTLSTGACTANPWPFPDAVHEVVGPPAPSNLPVDR